MLCQFSRLVYPKNIGMVNSGSYMVAIYTPCEKVFDSTGNTVTQIKAVGYALPTSEQIRYEMKGQWSKNSKHGLQFEVETYDEVIKPTKEGIIAYFKHGNLSLEYGEDFQFIDSSDISVSAELIAQVYVQEVNKYGVDNVALLTPYRQKTDTGVNALNERIRDIINPKSPLKEEILHGKRLFRYGDKVMQIKNHDDVNNGDIGYITKIEKSGNETSAYIDFGDGRLKEYDSSELDMIDLGYASTIHKSQGSEYRSVIINLQKAHYVMLTRPLVYTAITRGKERVIFVGERSALCTAIRRTDTEKRGTRLAKRLYECSKS